MNTFIIWHIMIRNNVLLLDFFFLRLTQYWAIIFFINYSLYIILLNLNVIQVPSWLDVT